MKLLPGNIFARTTQFLSVLLVIASLGFISISHHCMMAEKMNADTAPCCEHKIPPSDFHTPIKYNPECCNTLITGGITLDEIVIEKTYKFEKLKTNDISHIALPGDIPDHRESALQFAYVHQVHPKTPVKLHILNEAFLN